MIESKQSITDRKNSLECRTSRKRSADVDSDDNNRKRFLLSKDESHKRLSPDESNTLLPVKLSTEARHPVAKTKDSQNKTISNKRFFENEFDKNIKKKKKMKFA